MAGSITPESGGPAAVSFNLLQGMVSNNVEQVDQYVRDGFNGTGTRLIGKRATAPMLRGIKFVADLAAADAAVTAIEALNGWACTIVDDWGTSTANVQVIRTRPIGNYGDARKKCWTVGPGLTAGNFIKVEYEIEVRKL